MKPSGSFRQADLQPLTLAIRKATILFDLPPRFAQMKGRSAYYAITLVLCSPGVIKLVSERGCARRGQGVKTFGSACWFWIHCGQIIVAALVGGVHECSVLCFLKVSLCKCSALTSYSHCGFCPFCAVYFSTRVRLNTGLTSLMSQFLLYLTFLVHVLV